MAFDDSAAGFDYKFHLDPSGSVLYLGSKTVCATYANSGKAVNPALVKVCDNAQLGDASTAPLRCTITSGSLSCNLDATSIGLVYSSQQISANFQNPYNLYIGSGIGTGYKAIDLSVGAAC